MNQLNQEGGIFAPLRIRTFRLLFSGQVVSNLGDWLDYLALVVLIAYTWELGAAALAGLAIAVAVPWAFIAPFSGVLADRWPKRPVLIGCDLARAALVLGYVLAPNIWVLLTLVSLKTTFSTLFNPAQQATIRSTVPEHVLLAANSLSQLSVQSTKVLGPALSGVIVAFWSPDVAFVADSATFLVSAAILTRLPKLEVPTEGEGFEGGFWSELGAGLKYIVHRPALTLAISGISAAVFLVFLFDTLSPLALRALGFDATLLGFAVAGIGLGAVVSTLAIGNWGAHVNPFVLMGVGQAGAGALVAVIGVAAMLEVDTAPVVWLPVVLGIGVVSAGVLVPYPTILQLETPPELMGRVSATANAVPTVLQLVAPLLGAALAVWQGVGFVLTLAGAGLVVLGGVVLAIRPPVGVGVPTRPPREATGIFELTSAEPEVAGYIFRKEGG
jgi:MFS family permease